MLCQLGQPQSVVCSCIICHLHSLISAHCWQQAAAPRHSHSASSHLPCRGHPAAARVCIGLLCQLLTQMKGPARQCSMLARRAVSLKIRKEAAGRSSIGLVHDTLFLPRLTPTRPGRSDRAGS